MDQMHQPAADRDGRPVLRSRAAIMALLEAALRGERRAAGRGEVLAALRRAGLGPPSADDPLWLHEFRFAARAADVPMARRRVAEFAADCGLAGAELYDVELAAAEALGNAVRHGSPNGSLDDVAVRVGILDRAVAVEIVDRGAGFDASRMVPPAAGETHGRGIPFMRGLLGDLRIRSSSSGTSVVLLKRLRP